jgi:hypothetical protein
MSLFRERDIDCLDHGMARDRELKESLVERERKRIRGRRRRMRMRRRRRERGEERERERLIGMVMCVRRGMCV